MSELTHRATGHQIRTDEASVEFWRAAGYRDADGSDAERKAPARRRSTKKAAAKPSDKS